MSLTQLHHLLQTKYRWRVSYAAVCKYDDGSRPPDPEFVVLVQACFGLSDEQLQALKEAIITDCESGLAERFAAAKKELIEKGLLPMIDSPRSFS